MAGTTCIIVTAAKGASATMLLQTSLGASPPDDLVHIIALMLRRYHMMAVETSMIIAPATHKDVWYEAVQQELSRLDEHNKGFSQRIR